MPKVKVYSRAIIFMPSLVAFKMRFEHWSAPDSSLTLLRSGRQCIAFANHVARSCGQPRCASECHTPGRILDVVKEEICSHNVAILAETRVSVAFVHLSLQEFLASEVVAALLSSVKVHDPGDAELFWQWLCGYALEH